MPLLTVAAVVAIAGTPVRFVEAHATHGVDQPVGTASVTLMAPVPAAAVLNAPLTIIAGFNGQTATIFSGRISKVTPAVDESGATATIAAVGWASLLNAAGTGDIVYQGPMTLDKVFRKLCAAAGVPAYVAQAARYSTDTASGITAGAPISLGTNSRVNGGKIVIPANTTALAWLTKTAALFGYRVFDRPDGRVALARVSGLPNTAAVETFAEGVNCYRIERAYGTEGEVTYWEVTGATYTDATGVPTRVRSIPDAVPYAGELDPPGWRKATLSDPLLVTADLAEEVRHVHETSYGGPQSVQSWEADASPLRQPGDVVWLTSKTAAIGGDGGVNGKFWLMRLDQAVTDSGYYATATGWAGAGRALPAGDDCLPAIAVGTGPYHVGDQTKSGWAVPAPGGPSLDLTFTAPNDPFGNPTTFTGVTVSGLGHDINKGITEQRAIQATISSVTTTTDNSGDKPVTKSVVTFSGVSFTTDQWKSGTLLIVTGRDAGDQVSVESNTTTAVTCSTVLAQTPKAGDQAQLTVRTGMKLGVLEVWQAKDPLSAVSVDNPLVKRGTATLPVLGGGTNDSTASATTTAAPGASYGGIFAAGTTATQAAASGLTWKSWAVPVNGSLLTGDGFVRFVAGTLSDTNRDDFEIKTVTCQVCGVGDPAGL